MVFKVIQTACVIVGIFLIGTIVMLLPGSGSFRDGLGYLYLIYIYTLVGFLLFGTGLWGASDFRGRRYFYRGPVWEASDSVRYIGFPSCWH